MSKNYTETLSFNEAELKYLSVSNYNKNISPSTRLITPEFDLYQQSPWTLILLKLGQCIVLLMQNMKKKKTWPENLDE